MILESIVTTVGVDGQVNIAPMGPTVDGDPLNPRFTLRPFVSSRTYANLSTTKTAVIHVTDDAWLIARAAVDAVQPSEAADLVEQVGNCSSLVRLKDCHRWFAVAVDSISGEAPRFTMTCKVTDSGVERPFFGFNRAKHAVIEAAILATRTHILPADQITKEISRLRPLIDKTAGSDEHRAFDFLLDTIQQRIAQQQSSQQ